MSGISAQRSERPVATLWTGRLIVFVTVSVLLNVILGFLYYSQKQDTAFAREMTNEAVQERDLVMQLIPALGPTITPTTLAAELRSRYPGEEVNLVGRQVQWRLLHFWFDERGKLVEVKYYS